MSNFNNEGFFLPPPMPCQILVNELVLRGMTAIYVSSYSDYGKAFNQLKVTEVIIWSHSGGETVVLLGDNEIDVVRLKFPTKGGPLRKERGVE